ncbi:MAG: hypothetical protein A2166_01955 [Omnitrophica WOR_2 bacterium RBG_13_41_10]|nr:MAG: hypothetical protein A2166_01955 [Omnitrophica WOR_2 bacterium RBG_13_41_10]
MIKIGGYGKFFFFFVFLILATFCLINDAYAYKAIQLNQPKVRLIISPGELKTGRIEVKNPSEETKTVKIYVEDWIYTDDSGAKKFMVAGTDELSCADWITFVPQEFTVSPFGKEYVNYTVKVPKDAVGGHYAVLFFESLMGNPDEKPEGMVSMPVAIRIGSLFYIEAEGMVNRSMELGKVSLTRESNNAPLAINLEVKNTGNVDIIAGGNFNIIDNQGMVYARGEFTNKVYTLPLDKAIFNATWKGAIPKGKYDLVITLDLGKALEELSMGRGPMIVKEAELEIEADGEIVSVGGLK